MTDRWSKLIRAGLVAAVLCSLAFVASILSPREPTYEGQPLSYWLDRLPLTWATTNGGYATMETGFFTLPNGRQVQFGTRNPSDRQTAREAVDVLGTNALPALLASLGATEIRIPAALRAWGTKLRILDPAREMTSTIQRNQALTAILRLGPRARPIVPDLRALTRSKDARVSAAALTALQSVAPEEYVKNVSSANSQRK